MRFVGKDSQPHDAGNVFTPQPELDAARGGWCNRTARAAVAACAVAFAAAGGLPVRRR
jgi:hypothetical protein